MSLRFGTDGIRGVANRELTPELAVALGRAAARHLPGDDFFVGADTRRSSPMLKAALASGLAAEGRRVSDLAVLPTPGLAFLAAAHGAPGGMISASHNPFWDNGIKLISQAGTKLPDAAERAIEGELALLLAEPAGGAEPVVGESVGEIREANGLVGEYVDHLVKALGGADLSGVRVVCDCGNGAASAIAPVVLGRAGVAAHLVGDSPDGININAGCGAIDPSAVASAVLDDGADLGLSFDGDADRMIAVDHRGRVVDGDALLAMFAADLHRRGGLDHDAIAATVMSNLGLHRALAEQGVRVIETPVGDRYVADAIDENGLVLGGEQSGHIVFRREATTGDGLLTGLKLIELVARSGRRLADLLDTSITKVPQRLLTVRVSAPDRLADAAGVWEEVAAVERELGGSGRVVLRSSGTESAVRVMVEADTPAVVERALERIASAVERELGTSS